MAKKDSNPGPKIPDAELRPFPDESLGEYLRRLRLIRRLDLGDVSVRTPRVPESQHVSQSYLSQLELGRAQNPSRERLIGLARVLEVPEGWILERAGFSGGNVADSSNGLDAQSRRLCSSGGAVEPRRTNVAGLNDRRDPAGASRTQKTTWVKNRAIFSDGRRMPSVRFAVLDRSLAVNTFRVSLGWLF